jgi:hypothetical protein
MLSASIYAYSYEIHEQYNMELGLHGALKKNQNPAL